MKKLFACCVLSFLLVSSLHAENYLINGGQESQIKYQLAQKVLPGPGTKTLKLSFVLPTDFTSPTYNQRITNLSLVFSPEPNKKKEDVDKRGNKVIIAEWSKPKTTVEATMLFTGWNKVVLQTLDTQAPFPLKKNPSDTKAYLKASKQVQSDDGRIKSKARELTKDADTEFDAVQRILTWVVDHMRYVTPPKQYDALYSFNSGLGNCQNYSHLSAALMRAVDIPVRIVNGVTLKKPYDIEMPDGTFTVRMGQGRHSWIEVYFPDLGWVPFDPQQTELYVSNRFVRIEIGIDNEEAVQDGLVRWTASKGSKMKPLFQENIDAEFVQDNVRLDVRKQQYGPQKMLFCPAVQTAFKPVETPPPPPPPVKIDVQEVKKMQYIEPYIYGNLDFPEDYDFLSARGPARSDKEGEFEMRKNFMVETAEYVTTQAAQYAQIVVLRKPIKLEKVGLALHKFGGSGHLWVEIYKDNNGKPGEYVATSEMLSLNQLSMKPA